MPLRRLAEAKPTRSPITPPPRAIRIVLRSIPILRMSLQIPVKTDKDLEFSPEGTRKLFSLPQIGEIVSASKF